MIKCAAYRGRCPLALAAIMNAQEVGSLYEMKRHIFITACNKKIDLP